MTRFVYSIVTLIFLSSFGHADPQKVLEILDTLRKPKTEDTTQIYVLTEKDVNDWAQLLIDQRENLGVENISIDFLGNNRLSSNTVVDMDQVDLDNLSTQFFQTVLSGKQVVNLTGRLKIRTPRAEFNAEKTVINGVDVPIWLIESVFSYLSTNQEPNIDLSEPFFLPFGITNIEISKKTVTLTR